MTASPLLLALLRTHPTPIVLLALTAHMRPQAGMTAPCVQPESTATCRPIQGARLVHKGSGAAPVLQRASIARVCLDITAPQGKISMLRAAARPVRPDFIAPAARHSRLRAHRGSTRASQAPPLAQTARATLESTAFGLVLATSLGVGRRAFASTM